MHALAGSRFRQVMAQHETRFNQNRVFFQIAHLVYKKNFSLKDFTDTKMYR
ncbi:hypothetical protein DespoDRAFT_00178 [Desulfobacter postgatei 2ac9]|uniref:Uncharacterized protein n=1 Tax=Desulfobacter postgatei 2ac9 TaxID=879212 RepID=I5AYA9_9BACT|nr:hypothetical protein DespoDRAFT_00178 [Desulfobacter postgatei 2ac9]